VVLYLISIEQAKLKEESDHIWATLTTLGIMTDMETKLDLILKTVSNLDERMKNLELGFSAFDTQIKSNTTQIEQLKKEQVNMKKTIGEIQTEINKMKLERTKLQKLAKNENLSRELYSKRFNYLIHGIPESSENAWETREQTEKLFRKFVTEGLQITDPSLIKLADVHRLPQHPIYDRDGFKIDRPIIIKFIDVFDKQNFMKNLKHLKQYTNEKRLPSTQYVYATEHLPKDLQDQKKKLIPLYKEARKYKKKTVWKIINCEYCLFFDGERFTADK